MNISDINDLINKKGEVTRKIYQEFLFNEICDGYVNEIILSEFATYAYNCTLLLMKAIINNQKAIENITEMNKRNCERMRKDLQTMTRIEYEDELVRDDYKNMENERVENLMEKILKE